MTENNPTTIQRSYRFDQRTIDNIKAITKELKLASNDTQAIKAALEHYVTEERLRKQIKGENAQTLTVSNNRFNPMIDVLCPSSLSI